MSVLNFFTGPNMALFLGLLSIPGFARFLRTEFAYRNRGWLFRGSLLCEHPVIRPSLILYNFFWYHYQVPSQTLVSAMHRIRAVSRRILNEKLAEADVKDAESKRDIMSLLVR